MEELLAYLAVADFELREELVLKAAVLAERWAGAAGWRGRQGWGRCQRVGLAEAERGYRPQGEPSRGARGGEGEVRGLPQPRLPSPWHCQPHGAYPPTLPPACLRPVRPRFLPSLEWYVDSMLTLMERAGDFAVNDLWQVCGGDSGTRSCCGFSSYSAVFFFCCCCCCNGTPRSARTFFRLTYLHPTPPRPTLPALICLRLQSVVQLVTNHPELHAYAARRAVEALRRGGGTAEVRWVQGRPLRGLLCLTPSCWHRDRSRA